MASTNAPSVLKRLQRDEAFLPFMSSSFDATEFAVTVMTNEIPGNWSSGAKRDTSSVEAFLAKLSSHEASIDAAIRNVVTENHERLLSSVGDTTSVRAGLDSAMQRAHVLQASLQYASQTAIVPFRALQRKAATTERLQATCDVLRGTAAALALVEELPPSSAVQALPGRDLFRVAATVREIEAVLARRPGVARVPAVARVLPSVRATAAEVAVTGARAVVDALESGHARDLGNALQVLRSSGDLARAVVAQIAGIVEAAEAAVLWWIDGALDASTTDEFLTTRGARDRASRVRATAAPGSPLSAGRAALKVETPASPSRGVAPASARGTGKKAAKAAAVWARGETAFGVVSQLIAQAWLLLDALRRRRDAATNEPFARTVQSERARAGVQQPLRSEFWDGLCATLSRALASADAHPSVHSVFVTGYPRLRRLLRRALTSANETADRQRDAAGGAEVDGSRPPPSLVASLLPHDRAWAAGGSADSGGEEAAVAEAATAVARIPAARAAAAAAADASAVARRVDAALCAVGAKPDSARASASRDLPAALSADASQTTAAANVSSDADALVAAAAPLLTAFLARSAARVRDPVSLLFQPPAGSDTGALPLPPTRADVAAVISVSAAELSATRADVALCLAVAGGVVDAAKDFAAAAIEAAGQTDVAAEEWDPESATAPSVAQRHLAAVAARCEQLRAGLAGLPASALGDADAPGKGAASTGVKGASREALLLTRTLLPAQRALNGAAERALVPLLAGVARAVERVAAGMHDESFAAHSSDTAPGRAPAPPKAGDARHAPTAHEDAAASAFTPRLEQSLDCVARRVLPLLPASAVAKRLTRAFAARTLRQFCRHASLLRPLAPAGRARLVADLARLEAALAPITNPASIPGPYAELRGLRRLLFLSTEDAEREALAAADAPADCPLLALRPTVVLYHILSRAPADVPSPHTLMRRSPAGFARWLDSAAARAAGQNADRTLLQAATALPEAARAVERAALQALMEALDVHAQRVSARGAAAGAGQGKGDAADGESGDLGAVYASLHRMGGPLMAAWEEAERARARRKQ